MNPKWLKLQAFGPFANEEFIDFDKLKASGLFLIYGKTGAGKTSIFDSITCALYGQACDPERGGILKLRCQYAKKDTLVEFCFNAKGKTYLFACATRKKRGSEESVERVTAYELSDGEKQPLMVNFTRKAITKKAEEILGLTYDQFCRVVLLPQGRFEQLLVAKAKQKEEILKTLFGTQRYQNAADNIFELATKEEAKLREDEKVLLSILEPTGEVSVHALGAKLAVLKDERESAMKEKVLKESLYSARSADFERAKGLVKSFDALEMLTKEHKEIETKNGEILSAQQKIERVEKSLQIYPLWEATTKKKRGLDERINERESSRKAYRLAQDTFEIETKQYSSVEEIMQRQQKLKDALAEYKIKLETAKKNKVLMTEIEQTTAKCEMLAIKKREFETIAKNSKVQIELLENKLKECYDAQTLVGELAHRLEILTQNIQRKKELELLLKEKVILKLKSTKYRASLASMRRGLHR